MRLVGEEPYLGEEPTGFLVPSRVYRLRVERVGSGTVGVPGDTTCQTLRNLPILPPPLENNLTQKLLQFNSCCHSRSSSNAADRHP